MRRLVLSPRWIAWHLLTLGAMATCGWLAVWQWQRAGSAMGSALNVGYGLQWPLFAVFFGVMWWRMLRMEVAGLDEEPGHADRERANRDQADRDHADRDHAADPVAAGPGWAQERPAPSVAGPDPGSSPFGPRPASARPAAIADDSALADYNRMLARLNRDPED